MYKVVNELIEELHNIHEKYEYRYFDSATKEECKYICEDISEKLENIFKDYDWSEEFVICFSVCCNFYLLNGIHIVLGIEYCLERILDKISTDDESAQYLTYVWNGICTQDVECFEDAILMNIYDFDIPKLYKYILNYLLLCSLERSDFENNNLVEDITRIYIDMMNAKNSIVGELSEYTVPIELNSENTKMISKIELNLLPQIVVSSSVKEYQMVAQSDLDALSEIINKKVDTYTDMLEGYLKVYREYLNDKSEENENNMHCYKFFSDEFVRRIVSAKKYGDELLYNGKEKELVNREPIFRKDFLNLPVKVSRKQCVNIKLSELLEAQYEKSKIIIKNEQMVEDYANSVENIMKPALIADIAEYLRKDEKYKELYKKIMYSYYNEVTTRNECRLLKMVHNMSISKSAIREHFVKSKCSGNDIGISIRELVCKAINQITLMLTEDSKKVRYMFIMNKMNMANISEFDLENQLWDTTQKGDRLLKYFENQLGLKLCIDRRVEEIRLHEEELGTSFLYTRIVELLTNLFTYGEYDNTKMFELNILLDKDDYLTIEALNRIGDRSFSDNRVGNGLNATATMLEKINIINSEKKYFLISGEKEDTIYSTKLYIDADLYY